MHYFFIFIILFIINLKVQATSSFTFAQAIAIAYKNNPELQMEMDKAEAMRGLFIQSGLYPNPQLSLTLENLGGSGSFTGYETAETTLSIAQPIPLGHRLYYLKKATYADYLSSLARIKVQQAALYTEVGLTYVDALYAEQWHQVTKKLIVLNQNIVSAIKRRVKAGVGTELDLRLSQVRLGEAYIQENKAARDTLSKQAKLTRLLGSSLRVKRTLLDKDLPGTLLPFKELLKKIAESPQLVQKKTQLRAKRATITAVKKSVWPALNIQLGGRHFSDDGSNAAVVSAGAEIPTYNRNQGKIKAAEAEYTKTAHELQGVQNEVNQKVYSIFLQAEQSHYEADKVSNSLLPLARRSIKLAQEGYQMGRYSYIELATALNTLYEEERHYQQAHADFHKSLIQLTGLLGLKTIKGKP